MNKQLYILISSCLVLIGCTNTEGTLDIQGKVVDEITHECIPNRKAVIHGLVYIDSKLITTNAGQFSTDSTGRFSCTINKTKGAYSYNFCIVGDSTYSFLTQEIFLGELERDAKYLSFNLSKLTGVKIKIERISKTSLYDTLYVSWKTNEVDGKTLHPYKIKNYGVSPDIEFRWIGGNVKSEIETKVFAGKKTVVCWELFRNGKKKEILDTIFCERNVYNSISFKY